MSLTAGIRLGPYEILGVLGSGGMGEVYKAKDTRLERTVAIKVLPPQVSSGRDPSTGSGAAPAESTDERRARFDREARTIAGLNHPHICTLYDVGDHEGQMFFVMEHLVGQTLAERLENAPLTLEQALTVATEIADALNAAHRQGVIHRDLKPGNVMLTKSGAKLLDFGLAKLTGHGEQPAASYTVSTLRTRAATLTGQGVIVGTLQYMAPEQLEGKPPDARTDIWALGTLIYEMVTGRRAFEGTSAVSLMSAIMEREPPPIASFQPLTPPALDRLVRKCLRKEPDARWQSAADLADELRWLDEASDLSRSGAFAVPGLPASDSASGIHEERYRLSADVCRRIARDELEPRMIGDHLQYLDNRVSSDVLVVYLHGFGADSSLFRDVLATSPYRGLAVTLYGFEPAAPRRAALSLASHCTILRAFLAHMKGVISPAFTVLVGFSSGADVGLRLLGEWPADQRLVVDGYLSIGCNLNLDTCFVSRVLASEPSEGSRKVLQNLRASGNKAGTLAEWLNMHEYLVRIFRKFQSDLAPLHRHGKDIVQPFLDGANPFPGWFKQAAERVAVIRCVFADTDMERTPVKTLLLGNLDSRLLGERYGEESIQIEPGADHFDLLRAEFVNRYLAELVAKGRGSA